MKQRSTGIMAAATAITIAAIGQAWAQVPAPWPQQQQWAAASPYALNAPTPEDAYRQGLINRWELEQFAGPTPQALQGPSANGDKGNQDGGGGRQ